MKKWFLFVLITIVVFANCDVQYNPLNPNAKYYHSHVAVTNNSINTICVSCTFYPLLENSARQYLRDYDKNTYGLDHTIIKSGQTDSLAIELGIRQYFEEKFNHYDSLFVLFINEFNIKKAISKQIDSLPFTVYSYSHEDLINLGWAITYRDPIKEEHKRDLKIATKSLFQQ